MCIFYKQISCFSREKSYSVENVLFVPGKLLLGKSIIRYVSFVAGKQTTSHCCVPRFQIGVTIIFTGLVLEKVIMTHCMVMLLLRKYNNHFLCRKVNAAVLRSTKKRNKILCCGFWSGRTCK